MNLCEFREFLASLDCMMRPWLQNQANGGGKKKRKNLYNPRWQIFRTLQIFVTLLTKWKHITYIRYFRVIWEWKCLSLFLLLPKTISFEHWGFIELTRFLKYVSKDMHVPKVKVCDIRTCELANLCFFPFKVGSLCSYQSIRFYLVLTHD